MYNKQEHNKWEFKYYKNRWTCKQINRYYTRVHVDRRDFSRIMYVGPPPPVSPILVTVLALRTPCDANLLKMYAIDNSIQL